MLTKPEEPDTLPKLDFYDKANQEFPGQNIGYWTHCQLQEAPYSTPAKTLFREVGAVLFTCLEKEQLRVLQQVGVGATCVVIMSAQTKSESMVPTGWPWVATEGYLFFQ